MLSKKIKTANQIIFNIDSTTCIQDLFEEQVVQSPDSIAVICGDQKYTFLELNSRANQLANYLQQLGMGPEMLTGICVFRSIEMVIGILAILKAGGAFVPLDPSYPSERLSFILEDAGAQFVITQSGLISALPQKGKQVV